MRLGIITSLGGVARGNVRAERGAVSALVGILFGGGVIMGMAALSIDVGSLWLERRQVQNGADASALALAKVCAESPAKCKTTDTTTTGALTTLNNANNYQDGAGGFDTDVYANGMCGKNIASPASLPVCGTASTSLRDCPPVPASVTSTIPYVEVHTQTKQADGTSILPTWLIQTVTGTSKTSEGTRVRACARAAFGPVAPTSQTVFPIVMSYCDWASQTGYSGTPGSAVYPNGPVDSITPYGYGTANPWTSITERKIYTKSNPTTCSTWNGHSAPGGFYSISAGSCSSNSSVDGWIQATTGNSAPCSGMAALKGTVIHIPVFDCLQGSAITITAATDCTGQTGANKATGSNSVYHIAGYAAFYVTGWFFSSESQTSIKGTGVPCSGGERCISGWFLKDLVAQGDIATPAPGGTPNFGLTVIKPVG
jgi:Flp pilus assembly protein TadG